MTSAKTNQPEMVNIRTAQKINEAIGGAVVGPGDLDGLQDDFIEACLAWSVDYPRRLMEFNKRGKPK